MRWIDLTAATDASIPAEGSTTYDLPSLLHIHIFYLYVSLRLWVTSSAELHQNPWISICCQLVQCCTSDATTRTLYPFSPLLLHQKKNELGLFKAFRTSDLPWKEVQADTERPLALNRTVKNIWSIFQQSTYSREYCFHHPSTFRWPT